MLTKTDPNTPLGYEEYISSAEFAAEFGHLRILVCVLRDQRWEDLSSAAAKVLSNYDKVIIDVVSEAPPQQFWQNMVDRDAEWIDALAQNKVMIVDASTNNVPGFAHAFYPTFLGNWFHRNPGDCNTLPAKDRTVHFLSLARIPRLQRVMLTQEYFRRGINNKGIITCGCDDEPDTYCSADYIDPELRHLFPIKYEEKALSRGDAWSSATKEDFLKPIINVVIESSYDAIPYVNDDDFLVTTPQFWSKLFFTEKTNKAFAFHQIPVFLTVPGYVEMLRSWKFDVFDDVVDHSYDNEPDPWMRVYRVAAEVERLCSIPIEQLAATHNIDERFEYNKQHLLSMHNHFHNKCIETIKQFLRA